MTAVRHLTAAQLAERLRISVNAVYLMNHRGTGPRRMKRGGKRGPVLYRLADVEAWQSRGWSRHGKYDHARSGLACSARMSRQTSPT